MVLSRSQPAGAARGQQVAPQHWKVECLSKIGVTLTFVAVTIEMSPAIIMRYARTGEGLRSVHHDLVRP
jgi:hypothetical protein